MSSKVVGLISLGFTLVVVGITWMVFDGIITNRIIPRYWIETTYLRIMSMEFNGIPTIILIVGILILIMSGKSRRGAYE